MSASTSLHGKVALVTGGAKNLGRLSALELAELGADIAIHHHSNDTAKVAAETAEEIKSKFGRKVFIASGDLADDKVVEKIFLDTKKALGRVDIAVNTVGRVLKKPIVDITPKEFDEMDDSNNKSAFFFIQSAARHVENDGKIITLVTSLLAAYTGLYSSYAGTKAPVEHYTRAASKELMPRGISVNAIAPGPMDTPFFYGQETPEAVAYHKSAALKGQLTDIKDIAPIITFLVTKGWWFNGQTLFANGGYTTR